MKYAPEELGRFIATRLCNNGPKKITFSTEVPPEWGDTITQLCDELSVSLLTGPPGGYQQEPLPDFVRRQQLFLLQSMDEVYALMGKKPDPLERLKETLLARLDGLYQQLRRGYPGLFDEEGRMPAWWLKRERMVLGVKLRRVRKALYEKIHDSRLRELALAPFADFLNKNAEHQLLRHQNVRYLTILLGAMNGLIHTDTDDFDAALRNLLHVYNLNLPQFCTYYYSVMTQAALEAASLKGRLEALYDCLKNERQVTWHPGAVYLPGLPPVKEQVEGMIEEEVWCIEKKLRLARLEVSTAVEAPDNEEQPLFIIGTSVDLFAANWAVFFKAGFLLNENKEKMLAWVRQFFKKADGRTIGRYSLRTKFYAHEAGTVRDLKDFYMRCYKIACEL